MSERIRLTITVTPEVHAVFTRIADASGQSLGRTMGDWLCDTAEGAQFVASKMEEARRAPKTVMREFQAMARGLVDAVDEEVEAIRKRSMAGGGEAPAQRRRATAGRAAGAGGPPSSPTGVNTPPRKAKK